MYIYIYSALFFTYSTECGFFCNIRPNWFGYRIFGASLLLTGRNLWQNQTQKWWPFATSAQIWLTIANKQYRYQILWYTSSHGLIIITVTLGNLFSYGQFIWQGCIRLSKMSLVKVYKLSEIKFFIKFFKYWHPGKTYFESLHYSREKPVGRIMTIQSRYSNRDNPPNTK